jgi:hypothetical protein
VLEELAFSPQEPVLLIITLQLLEEVFVFPLLQDFVS